MKSNFIFLMILFFSPLALIGQINSDILLQEGTRWTEGVLDTYQYTLRSQTDYVIKGDSLIEKKVYKKVHSGEACVTLLREDENRNVYLRYNDPKTQEPHEILLYTFEEWSAGNPISYFANRVMKTVTKTIQEGDLTDVKLKNGEECKQYQEFIIQGIGDIQRGLIGLVRAALDNGTSWIFIRIYNNKNELLYENEELKFLQTHLVTDGVHWVERHSAEDNPDLPDPASDSYELMHFRINGDTVLHGKTYKKVYRNDTYYTGLREEDAFNVWRTTENGESLLYTFDWQAPLGRFTNERGEDFKLPAGSTERTSIAGGEYITCKVPYNPDKSADPFRTHNKDIRLILNIGLTSGIFSHIQPARDCYCFNDLVGFYDGDKLIYQNPVFTQTGEVLSIDTPRKEGSLSVLIWGNEVVFSLRNLSGKEHTVLNVYSAEGMQIASYSLQTGSVTVNDLPGGIYFYRLDKGKGMVETGKFSIIE